MEEDKLKLSEKKIRNLERDLFIARKGKVVQKNRSSKKFPSREELDSRDKLVFVQGNEYFVDPLKERIQKLSLKYIKDNNPDELLSDKMVKSYSPAKIKVKSLENIDSLKKYKYTNRDFAYLIALNELETQKSIPRKKRKRVAKRPTKLSNEITWKSLSKIELKNVDNQIEQLKSNISAMKQRKKIITENLQTLVDLDEDDKVADMIKLIRDRDTLSNGIKLATKELNFLQNKSSNIQQPSVRKKDETIPKKIKKIKYLKVPRKQIISETPDLSDQMLESMKSYFVKQIEENEPEFSLSDSELYMQYCNSLINKNSEYIKDIFENIKKSCYNIEGCKRKIVNILIYLKVKNGTENYRDKFYSMEYTPYALVSLTKNEIYNGKNEEEVEKQSLEMMNDLNLFIKGKRTENNSGDFSTNKQEESLINYYAIIKDPNSLLNNRSGRIINYENGEYKIRIGNPGKDSEMSLSDLDKEKFLIILKNVEKKYGDDWFADKEKMDEALLYILESMPQSMKSANIKDDVLLELIITLKDSDEFGQYKTGDKIVVVGDSGREYDAIIDPDDYHNIGKDITYNITIDKDSDRGCRTIKAVPKDRIKKRIFATVVHTLEDMKIINPSINVATDTFDTSPNYKIKRRNPQNLKSSKNYFFSFDTLSSEPILQDLHKYVLEELENIEEEIIREENEKLKLQAEKQNPKLLGSGHKNISYYVSSPDWNRIQSESSRPGKWYWYNDETDEQVWEDEIEENEIQALHSPDSPHYSGTQSQPSSDTAVDYESSPDWEKIQSENSRPGKWYWYNQKTDEQIWVDDIKSNKVPKNIKSPAQCSVCKKTCDLITTHKIGKSGRVTKLVVCSTGCLEKKKF
jgi:hypothetical protein